MLKIYVNTWGNYNTNGAYGGRWIELPMDPDALYDELKDIADDMGDHDPEWFINDYEWTGDEFGKVEEMDNIRELNEKCQAIENLDKWQLEVYAAAVEYWGEEYVDIDDLDDYILYSDIHSKYDLGYYWACESGCYDLDKMGHLANYIDFEAFGRDISYETDGGFTSYGFIERAR